MQITCATWNVHRAVGHDNTRDPARVVQAIETALVPQALDILALQEADEECPPHARIIDVARVSDMTGLIYQHDEARLRWGPQSDGFLGTILWAHPRFARTHADVIDLPGHCHRGVISTEFTSEGHSFRVMSGHFSLSQPLRIVLGSRFAGPALRTFPTKRPLLPLDRIMTNAPSGVTHARVIDTDITNLASDHRPLVGVVNLSRNPAPIRGGVE